MYNKTDKAWAKLAAAIIKGGEDANDQQFLKSKWCEALRYMVKLQADRRRGYDICINKRSVK